MTFRPKSTPGRDLIDLEFPPQVVLPRPQLETPPPAIVDLLDLESPCMNPAPSSGGVVGGIASATPFQALGQSELGAIEGYSTPRARTPSRAVYTPGGTRVPDRPSPSPGYASPKYASRIMFTPGGTRVPDNTPPPTPPKAVSFGDISVKHLPTSPSGYVQLPGPSLSPFEPYPQLQPPPPRSEPGVLGIQRV